MHPPHRRRPRARTAPRSAGFCRRAKRSAPCAPPRALQADAIGQDLHRHMAVAQRMRDFARASEYRRALRSTVRRRDDFDRPRRYRAAARRRCAAPTGSGKSKVMRSALLSRDDAARCMRRCSHCQDQVSDDLSARFAGAQQLDGAGHGTARQFRRGAGDHARCRRRIVNVVQSPSAHQPDAAPASAQRGLRHPCAGGPDTTIQLNGSVRGTPASRRSALPTDS